MAEARRKVLVGATIAVTAAFFVAAFAYGYVDSGGWYVQRIEVCDTQNRAVAAATDSSGSIHAAFHGVDDRRWVIKHAVRTDGDWRVSNVCPSSDKISNLRLSVGQDSKVEVSWCTYETGFYYAHSKPDGFEKISVCVEDFENGDIAIDSDGNVHGFCSVQHWITTPWPSHWEWEFQHWMVSSGEWTLVSSFDLPENTKQPSVGALLIHGNDDPQAIVSLTSNLTESTYFARAVVKDSGLEIDDPFMWGDDFSIHDAEIDSQGRVHLAVKMRVDTPTYHHWIHDGETWTSEMVDYVGDNSWSRADLQIDSRDTAYLTYIQESYAFDLSYLKVAEKKDGVWDTVIFYGASSAFGGGRPALAVVDGDYHVVRFAFDGKNKNVLTYANSDNGEVIVEELRSAALWTALMAVIVFPTVFAVSRWRAQRRQRKERLERIGLYDDQLK